MELLRWAQRNQDNMRPQCTMSDRRIDRWARPVVRWTAIVLFAWAMNVGIAILCVTFTAQSHRVHEELGVGFTRDEMAIDSDADAFGLDGIKLRRSGDETLALATTGGVGLRLVAVFRVPSRLPSVARPIPGEHLILGAIVRYQPDLILTYAGWPMISMYGESWKQLNGQLATRYEYQWAVPIAVRSVKVGGPPPVRRERAIPLRPLALGTIVNTTVYAIPIVVLFWLLPAMRRNARRARGHCERCSYSLVGVSPDGICPECGLHSSCRNTTGRAT